MLVEFLIQLTTHNILKTYQSAYYQSAYYPNNYCETALISITCNILLTLDILCTLTVLLDSSAAFDTLDHNAKFLSNFIEPLHFRMINIRSRTQSISNYLLNITYTQLIFDLSVFAFPFYGINSHV